MPGQLKTLDEIEKMAQAGRAVAMGLDRMKRSIVPGKTTTLELDAIAEDELKKHGAIPSLKNYQPPFSSVPYLHTTCISINDEVIHGVPGERVIKAGDVVGLDLTAHFDGWHADSAITVIVGSGSKQAQRLVAIAQEALAHAIKAVRVGATLGDIGHAVQRLVERNGFGVIRDLSGHGIGTSVHEDGLEVTNFGTPGKGVRLEAGMTFSIEPMITAGIPSVTHRPGDPWTVVTRDRSLGAHFEHTIALLEDGPRVLTALPKP
jgi:methionyl aminopeptidase